MRIALFIIFSFIGLSCSKGQKASYKVDPTFNKLDESQYLEKNEIGEEISIERLEKDFSYLEYYRLLNERVSLLPKGPSKELINLAKTIPNFCSEETINLQLDILLAMLNKAKTSGFIHKIIQIEKDLISNCETLNNLDDTKTRKIHSFVLSLNKKELKRNLDFIIDIDQLIVLKSTNVNKNHSSFSAIEIRDIIFQLLDINDLDSLSELVILHQRISPLSSIRRVEILEKAFKNPAGLTVFENSTIKSSAQFLTQYLSIKDQVDQNKLKSVLSVLITKFGNKYNRVTRYEDIEKILELAWDDYTKLFDLLNSKQLKHKVFVIQNFNKINSIIEKLYELPLNRVPAKNYLSNIYGRYEFLALFHQLRYSSSDEQIMLLQDYSHIDRETLKDHTLDQLLKLRIKLYSKKEPIAKLENYCNFLNQIRFRDTSFKQVSDLKSLINNQNTFGCFELKNHFRNFSDLDIEKDKKNILNIEVDKIESPIDMVIKAVDTDVSIKTEYYRGPTWNLPTVRLHKKRDNIKTQLDSRTSIFVIDVKLHNNDKIHFPSSDIRLFYNYDLKLAERPDSEEDYIGDMPLKKGFRGGHLNISVNSNQSIPPLLIAPGGIGQLGPDAIHPGKGINSSLIYDRLLNPENVDYYNNLLYGDFNSVFPNLDRFKLKALAKYNFDVVINKEETIKLHKDLCQKSPATPYQLCYISGDTPVFKNIGNTELGLLDDRVYEELNHAMQILNNEVIVDELLSTKFNFPPSTKNSKGSPVIFSNGKNGNEGKLKFKIRRN